MADINDYFYPETSYEVVTTVQKSTDATVVSVFYKDDKWHVKLPGGVDAFKCKWSGTDVVIGDHFEKQMCNNKETLSELFDKCNKNTTYFYLLSLKPSPSNFYDDDADTRCIKYCNSYLNTKLQNKKYIKLYNIYFDSYIKIDKTRCCCC